MPEPAEIQFSWYVASLNDNGTLSTMQSLAKGIEGDRRLVSNGKGAPSLERLPERLQAFVCLQSSSAFWVFADAHYCTVPQLLVAAVQGLLICQFRI